MEPRMPRLKDSLAIALGKDENCFHDRFVIDLMIDNETANQHGTALPFDGCPL
jgi:hypothetical protein